MRSDLLELDDVTGVIVDASVRIHRNLGPGLFESVYEALLASALRQRGLCVEQQKMIGLSYEGLNFEQAFRADLLVERSVIAEIKSIDRLAPVHTKQMTTYLRLLNLQVGLILNFGAPIMKEGIRRVVNDLPRSASPGLRVNH